MRYACRLFCLGFGWFSMLSLMPATSFATVIWNEAVNGNLSGSGSSPTDFTLSTGTNSVIGSVGGGANLQDWVNVTIPAGSQLSNYVLAAYSSNDAQGFTGVQVGTSFVGSTNSAGSYLGYAHFGTGATNGSGASPTNLIGSDLLPIMGSATTSPGAIGFTPPLPAGSYTFLIQQLGAATSYQFDFDVTNVPEPCAPAVLTALSAVGVLRPRRRR